MPVHPVYTEGEIRFKGVSRNGRQPFYTSLAQRKREKRWLLTIAFSRFHLSGHTSPSSSNFPRNRLRQCRILHINIEDISTSRAIIDAGQLLDIDIVDHLIIAGRGLSKYVSLRDRGLAFDD